MASVTQTIPTFLGGVSKQIDSKKKPGQVRESINEGIGTRQGTCCHDCKVEDIINDIFRG